LTVLLIILFFTSGFQTHYFIWIAARIMSILYHLAAHDSPVANSQFWECRCMHSSPVSSNAHWYTCCYILKVQHGIVKHK
jgi:cobalamin biosynthesis protein CobD/CbiB